MIVETVFIDIEFQAVVEFPEKVRAFRIGFSNDDGIFVAEVLYVCKSGTEHRVGGYKPPATFAVIILESVLHRSDIRNDTIPGQIWMSLSCWLLIRITG